MTEHVLVTGGCGFIGSWTAEELLRSGYRVRAVDDLSVGRQENLPSGAAFLKGDIADAGVVSQALEDVDTVVHLAARVTIRDSFRGLTQDVRTNVLGTAALLQGLTGTRVTRLVFASSMAVYGHARRLPLAEDHFLAPISPYGIGKTACEAYITNYCQHIGIRPVILRYFNTYGPRQAETPYVGVIRIFTTNALLDRPLEIYGDGRQQRDFISVHDVSRATVRAIEYDGPFRIFNVGTGKGTDINSLAYLIRELTSSRSDILHRPNQPGEPRDSVADTSRLEQELGFSPELELEDALPELIDWVRLHLNRRVM